MLIGFVQGYEELKWGITSKLNPLCNGPYGTLLWTVNDCMGLGLGGRAIEFKIETSKYRQAQAVRTQGFTEAHSILPIFGTVGR